MKEIKCSSTNGRWGLTIVHEDGVKFPAKGILDSLGKIEGHDTFQFTADENGDWIVLGGDLEPVSGCKIISKMGLQSNDYVTLLSGGKFLAYKSFGYKGRSENLVAMKDGVEVKLPASVLAAMGIIPCEKTAVDTEPPALNSSLADALKKAGL